LSSSGPPKDTSLAETTSFQVFFYRKNPCRDVGCGELQKPKKRKKLVTPEVAQNHVYWEEKPPKGAR